LVQRGGAPDRVATKFPERSGMVRDEVQVLALHGVHLGPGHHAFPALDFFGG
jgi:hypothetical protein